MVVELMGMGMGVIAGKVDTLLVTSLPGPAQTGKARTAKRTTNREVMVKGVA